MTNISTITIFNHNIRYTKYQHELYFASVDILEMLMEKRYSLNTTYYLKTYVPEEWCQKLPCDTVRGEKELWFINLDGVCRLAEVFSQNVQTLLEEIREQLFGDSHEEEHPATPHNVVDFAEYKKLHQEIEELQNEIEELEEENEELLEEIEELEDVLDDEIDYEREIVILERKREHANQQLDKALQAFGIATLMNTRLEIIGEEEIDFTVGL